MKGKQSSNTLSLVTVVTERIIELRKRRENPEEYVPVRTPLHDLNTILNGGLPRVEAFYLVILGREKLGKTTLLNHFLANHTERTGKRSILYNLEETRWQYADRMLTMRSAGVNRTNIYKIDYSEDDLKYLESIAQDLVAEDLYVNDRDNVLQVILEDAIARDIHVIGIDNFQLLVGKDREAMEANSKMIMRARNDHGITTFLGVQGNEKDYSFGSTQPFRDGDYVLELRYKYDKVEGSKKRGPILQGLRELGLTRSRHSGIGSLDIMFSPQYSRVGDVALIAEDPKKVEDFMIFDENKDFDFTFEEEEIENGQGRYFDN